MNNNPENNQKDYSAYPENVQAKLRSFDLGIERLSEIEKGNVTDINEAIATYTNISLAVNGFENDDESSQKMVKDCANIAMLYGYLRDTMKVTTTTDAAGLLEERKIDPKIVELWLEEGMIRPNYYLSNAIIKGYPELAAKIKRETKQ